MTVLYNRVMFKISGEALAGKLGFGFDVDIVKSLANQLSQIVNSGISVCVTVGGGNIFRGGSLDSNLIERRCAHQIGMLSTVMNAIVVNDNIRAVGIKSYLLSSVGIDGICRKYDAEIADSYLNDNSTIILAAGLGSPFFTTDSSAILRAVELKCDIVMKGTQVDGIYSGDPKIDSSVKKYDEITAQDAIEQNLKVMDSNSLVLSRDNNMPICIFNMHEKDALIKVIEGLVPCSFIRN